MLKKIFIIILSAAVLSGCVSSGESDRENRADKSNEAQEKNSQAQSDDLDKEDEYFIDLTSPQKDQVLKSPFLIGGAANVPSDVVYIRVKNTDGDVLISEQTRVKHEEDSETGAFGVLIKFIFHATDQGVVEVYGIDDETGQEVAVKSVDVNFDVTSSGNAQNPAQ